MRSWEAGFSRITSLSRYIHSVSVVLISNLKSHFMSATSKAKTNETYLRYHTSRYLPTYIILPAPLHFLMSEILKCSCFASKAKTTRQICTAPLHFNVKFSRLRQQNEDDKRQQNPLMAWVHSTLISCSQPRIRSSHRLCEANLLPRYDTLTRCHMSYLGTYDVSYTRT